MALGRICRRRGRSSLEQGRVFCLDRDYCPGGDFLLCGYFLLGVKKFLGGNLLLGARKFLRQNFLLGARKFLSRNFFLLLAASASLASL